MTVQFKRDVVRNAIVAQKGKFFTIVFESKADGSKKTINGRTGVVKFLKGGVSTISGKPDLVGVFNVQKMAYRSVFLDSVKEIRASGEVIKF